MTIKKSIVGSLFSMLLGSEMAAADWGDVYYCQMTNFDKIKLEGEKENYTLEKFQFKLDQTKNAMVFGSTGFFQDEVIDLTSGVPDQEVWYANYENSGVYFFKEGKFFHTSAGPFGISSVSADCDKF